MSKTFKRITNNNIYDSIQSLHKKHDILATKYAVHDVKIQHLQRTIYGSIGVAVTLSITFVFSLLSKLKNII